MYGVNAVAGVILLIALIWLVIVFATGLPLWLLLLCLVALIAFFV